ncbi:hypothetical protein LPJ73_003697, partial [Coemansia sp. RSA 2703]
MFNVPYLTSCNHCREKKRRCDGKRPTCSLCQSHGVPCEYRRSRRFRKVKPGAPETHTMPNIQPTTNVTTTPSSTLPPYTPASAPPGAGLGVFLPHAPAASSLALNNSPNALTQLLSGDMYPLTQPLPQPILQGVNNFMSPFSNPHAQSIPEWISQQKPGAAMISNLESLASAYQESPLTPMRTAATPDDALLGSLTSQIMYGGNMGTPVQMGSGVLWQGAQQQQQQQPVQHAGAFSIRELLAPVTSAASVPAQAVPVQPLAFGDLAGLPLPYGGPRRTSSLRSGASHDSGASAKPPNNLSPNGTPQPRTNGTNGTNGTPQPTQPATAYPEDFVPEILRTYAREFPADLSPHVLLKVMRSIYSSTRTSLVNVDIELSWYMILKGIVPRILLFAYIASMARGQVVAAELVRQLPPNFDEICYDVAIRDVPLAVQSPSLWSALSLHLLGRYEFQSARYDLMMQHYEMASDVLTRTTFHGHAFPWSSVPSSLKRSFEYDYYVYTFWVGFQWHLVSCFSLDRPFNISLDPARLPQAATSGAYFAPDLPCEIDLLTLVPANSWPQRTHAPPRSVWFRGFNDPEFSAWRPAEWKKITPNYKITAHLQRMLPLGAHLYRLQREYCDGRR